jgi:hypothetical protein
MTDKMPIGVVGDSKYAALGQRRGTSRMTDSVRF